MEFKARISRQMLDIFNTAGKQIIDGDPFISFCQQDIAKMRSKETCSTCYKHAHYPRFRTKSIVRVLFQDQQTAPCLRCSHMNHLMG